MSTDMKMQKNKLFAKALDSFKMLVDRYLHISKKTLVFLSILFMAFHLCIQVTYAQVHPVPVIDAGSSGTNNIVGRAEKRYVEDQGKKAKENAENKKRAELERSFNEDPDYHVDPNSEEGKKQIEQTGEEAKQKEEEKAKTDFEKDSKIRTEEIQKQYDLEDSQQRPAYANPADTGVSSGLKDDFQEISNPQGYDDQTGSPLPQQPPVESSYVGSPEVADESGTSIPPELDPGIGREPIADSDVKYNPEFDKPTVVDHISNLVEGVADKIDERDYARANYEAALKEGNSDTIASAEKDYRTAEKNLGDAQLNALGFGVPDQIDQWAENRANTLDERDYAKSQYEQKLASGNPEAIALAKSQYEKLDNQVFWERVSDAKEAVKLATTVGSPWAAAAAYAVEPAAGISVGGVNPETGERELFAPMSYDDRINGLTEAAIFGGFGAAEGLLGRGAGMALREAGTAADGAADVVAASRMAEVGYVKPAVSDVGAVGSDFERIASDWKTSTGISEAPRVESAPEAPIRSSIPEGKATMESRVTEVPAELSRPAGEAVRAVEEPIKPVETAAEPREIASKPEVSTAKPRVEPPLTVDNTINQEIKNLENGIRGKLELPPNNEPFASAKPRELEFAKTGTDDIAPIASRQISPESKFSSREPIMRDSEVPKVKDSFDGGVGESSPTTRGVEPSRGSSVERQAQELRRESTPRPSTDGDLALKTEAVSESPFKSQKKYSPETERAIERVQQKIASPQTAIVEATSLKRANIEFDSPSGWNKFTELSPREFREQLGGNFSYWKDTPMSITRNQDGNVHVQMFHDDGVGMYHAEFNPSEKVSTLHWAEMSHDAQGGGWGAKMLDGMVKTSQEMGISKMTVDAELEAGGYAWGRLGFLPESEAAWLNLRDTLWNKYNDLKSSLPADVKSKVEPLLNPENSLSCDPANLWKVSDMEYKSTSNGETLGRKLLSNTKWKGVFDLSNKAQLNRLKVYLRSKGLK